MNNVCKNMFLLALSATAALARTGEIRPGAASRHDGTITAPGRNGDVVLSTRDLDIDITLPSGKQWKARLVVLFDPSNGWYLQCLSRSPGYTATNFASSAKIFVTPERIVAFSPTWRSITIWESKEKASGLNDAEDKALRQEESYLPDFPMHYGTAAFDMRNLGWEFQQPPLSAAGPVEAKILRVTQQDGRWELTLEARWKVKVVLNDKFQLLEQTRID